MSSEVKYEAPTADNQSAMNRFLNASRVGISKQEVTDIYKTWANAYDNDAGQAEYNGPRFGAQLLYETLGNNKTARVLDAASGTGLGGKLMKEMGYTNMDALDASGEMLEQSKKQECYTNYIEAFLDKNRLPIDDDTYDMVITYGSFVPGHVTEDCFKELARVVKPGGYLGMIMCERYFEVDPEYAGNIEPHMQELVTAGVWKRLRRDVFPRYHGDYNGVNFVCQMKEGKNEILKTLP